MQTHRQIPAHLSHQLVMKQRWSSLPVPVTINGLVSY